MYIIDIYTIMFLSYAYIEEKGKKETEKKQKKLNKIQILPFGFPDHDKG